MIFGLINRNSGPGFHRIHVPLMLMRDTDVYITNAATEAVFEEKKPTTIFYNRSISDDILSLQSKYQFKIVVDVDDYWELDASHILYRHHYENRINEQYIKHIRLADTVTTTHNRLAELIYPINRNVVVLPNAIPIDPYFPKFRMPNKSKHMRRIFWQGSVTHGKDIELLRGPFRKLDKNRFAPIIAGYMPNEPEWDRMVTCFTDGLRLNTGMVLPGADVTKYYSNYQYADVCVAPLRDTLFNSMKSNLKILEAAHIGAPVIASHVHPYKNIDGLMYVNKQSDWTKCLHSDTDVLRINAKLLSEWAAKYHDFETINELRKNVLI